MRSVPLPFLSKITLLWTRAREPGPVSPVKVDSPLPFPWTQRGEIYNLATTENPLNVQNLIRFPVHIAFSIVIIGKRKPPKEQSLWRFWCARLDSNQRPTESELSGRQRRNPGFMRVSGTSHKFSAHLRKPWKPLAHLGSHGFSGFWEIVVKQ